MGEIRRTLDSLGYRDLALLDYEVLAGRVIIRGVVRSYYLKQMAQEAVRQVPGVKGIRNLTVVEPKREPLRKADIVHCHNEFERSQP